MEPPAAIRPLVPHPHATLTSVSTTDGGFGVQLWPAGAAAGRWKRETVQGTVRKGERGGDDCCSWQRASSDRGGVNFVVVVAAVAIAVPVVVVAAAAVAAAAVVAAAAGVIVLSGVAFRTPLRLGCCSVLDATGAK